jgi:flagellar biosynthetic protein FliQ
MTQEFVIHLAKNALTTTLLVSSPLLLAGLIVGLSVSIVQAVTQINEMTLTFVPKIIAVAVAFAIFLPWILRLLVDFTVQLFQMFPSLVQ